MDFLTTVTGSYPRQQAQKDTLRKTSVNDQEALEMIKQRDAQWESKIEKGDSLISAQKVLIADYEGLVGKLEDQTELDSLLLNAKDKQIDLLHARDEMNEKMVKLVKPKWYENQYLWLAMGFILGKI